ncbi:AAA family ATPase [Actinomadura rayongensis]|uniref:Nuclease SbcCD subunit C n=1 Tax=Actinomadura rayongensis TaxID=1429076 RepID=A0A6I4W988_9ACTN|nr:AAA family ATPase [Actinomadura rayongensis]
MRLHRLTITAFGPFSGTEDIDFDALSDAGLFLIRGRTGAGKTSVLDAVCFALYGQVPGVRNAAKNLRSDHAAPGTAPEVSLETTIRGRRLRVTRSPAWERPKLRGTGTTSEKARVLLQEFERGAWTALSTRLDEAGEVVTRLLGMNPAQFCQVALLPQGEFAGFLRAGAEERRKVLEKLFAAEVFTQVEKWLADRRQATHRRADELSAAAQSVADRIAETTGSPAPLGPRGQVPAPRPGDAVPLDLDVLPGWAAGLAADLAVAADAAADAARTSAAALDATRAALDAARVRAEAQTRRAAALARKQALEERAAERSDLASRLDAAARADRVLPLLRAAEDRRHRAVQAARREDETRERVAVLLPPGASDDVLGKAERDRRDEVAALETRRSAVRRLHELAGERERADREIAALTERARRAEAALAALPARVEERRTALAAAQRAAASVPGLRAAAEHAERRRDDARRRDRVALDLAAAEDAHRAAVDEAQRVKDVAQHLLQARLDGMAAVLAGELREGTPCAVCGSAEHPAPAVSTAVIPDEDEIERAREATARADRARDAAHNEVSRLSAEHAALVESVGDASVADLDTVLADARAELTETTGRAADETAHETALRAEEKELEAAGAEAEEIARTLATRRARAAEHAAEQDRLRAELDRARGDDPSLDARVDRLRHEADALRAAADAARDAVIARDERAAARAAADAALADEGFRTPEDARAAALTDEQQAPLRDRQRRFDREEAFVREELDNAELRAAADGPAPDLPALENAFAVAEAARTAAASAADQARRRGARLDQLRAELSAALHAWRPAAEEHAVAARLAGLASGKDPANRRDMSLSAYVLAARLEQVVHAANERLGRMSSGRYVLAHTVEKAAGDRSRGAGGLGLRVADAWTGQTRDPATLSGGESFITSLALALGLADVVTDEAGGTEINTLFVDEGFGTLDEDTLDEVMDVLDGLRDGGRAVGVVSHVAELRARVPAQLHVRKERAGSTTDVRV